MIWEELNEPLIMLDVQAKTMPDVMRAVGGALTEQGYGKATYVDALIERETEYPTGLDIDGVGIAIPHTAVDYVDNAAIAVAKLAQPVTFEEMGTDGTVDVKLVFMLCVTDPKAHLADLQRIIAIVQDKSVLETLLTAGSAQDVIDTIKEKELSL